MFNTSNLSTLYVSQKNGNDRSRGFLPYDNGCFMGPVNSIELALNTVSQMRIFGANQPVTIKILDEKYEISSPIVLDKTHSNLTIEGTEGTLISGGMEVSGFKKDTFNGVECVSVDLSDKGEPDFSDFDVKGKACERPKFPEEGTLCPEAVENNEPWVCSKWFVAKEEDFKTIKNFKNKEDLWVSFNHYWIDEHTPVESVDLTTGKIEFKYVSRFTLFLDDPVSSPEYYIENVAEMFKKPNQWYYDKKAKKLYYIPENADEEIVGYIPLTNKIFVIKGEEDNKAKNIFIRNLSLAYTKGEYVSTSTPRIPHPQGEVGYASDYQSVWSGHGGIEFENACGCSVENCKLYCFGAHGVVVKDGSSRIRITGNEITDLGGGGITMSGGEAGSDTKTHTFGNTISDNTILRLGNRYSASCGILIRHSYDNIVSHNEIGDLYYSGISCGWVWGYADSVAKGNIIEKNHIHDLGKGKLSDMGGIYLLGIQEGTIVRGNVIHGIDCNHYGGWALYADEGCSQVIFENNLCYDTADASFDLHFGYGNVVRNNIFIRLTGAVVLASRPAINVGIIAERNIIVSNNAPIFKVGYLKRDCGSIGMISSMNNLVYDISGRDAVAFRMMDAEYSIKQAQEEFGMDIGSVCADPMFIDFENKDFRLKENSPAIKMGFVPFDISDVGVRR